MTRGSAFSLDRGETRLDERTTNAASLEKKSAFMSEPNAAIHCCDTRLMVTSRFGSWLDGLVLDFDPRLPLDPTDNDQQRDLTCRARET
jgi:hypothetical protein